MCEQSCPRGELIPAGRRNFPLTLWRRIAHRLRDMQRLPYVVVTNPHINDVYNLYYNAFDTFRKIKEIKTLEENDKLCDIIGQMLKGHLTVIPKLAMGILECGGLMNPADLDKFMNTILRSASQACHALDFVRVSLTGR